MRPALAAVLALAALPAPAAASSDWRDHVQGPSGPHAYPRAVAVVGDGGAVDDPNGLTAPGGTATTMRPGGRLVLDLGTNTGGVVEVGIRSGAGELRLAYAEARRYLSPLGDTIQPSLGINDVPDGRFDVVPAAPGLRWSSPAVRGGQRWISFELDTPAPVAIDYVRVRVTHLASAPDDYAGHFLSSDDVLNRAWYASAHTYFASVADDPPVLMDGAKRDRMVFAGDLAIGQLVGFNTAAAAPAVAKASLRIFSCQQSPNGDIPGNTDTNKPCPDEPPEPSPANLETLVSGEYVAWYVVAARDYLQYTGDDRYVRRLLPVLRRAVGFLRDNEEDGLYTGGRHGILEYNWRANTNNGQSSYTNVVYIRALRSLAELERRLGAGEAAALALEEHAEAVRSALFARLYDPAVGAFRVNTDDALDTHAQDANVQAVVAGVLEGHRADRALEVVRERMWTPIGPKNADRDDDRFVTQYISPFTSSWELLARFERGDAPGALELIRRLWGHMQRMDPEVTVWEKVGLDGLPQPNQAAGAGTLPTWRPEGEGYVSLAHAWSGGPVPALTGYVLGIRPTAPGFRSWLVAPQPGDLRWARGQVETPHGPLVSDWQRDGDAFRLTVVSPPGTSGEVHVPSVPRGATVTIDGRPVRASRRGGVARVRARRGRHTYAWRRTR